MSHFKERTEKHCLNCGTSVHGRYCHSCGQENIEPKETIVHLVSHFFKDITHFDGKFFSTLKYPLLLKLFYARRKNYYYTDHAIFSLHYYILIFIVMLVFFGIAKLNDYLYWSFLSFLNVALGLFILNHLKQANVIDCCR